MANGEWVNPRKGRIIKASVTTWIFGIKNLAREGLPRQGNPSIFMTG